MRSKLKVAICCCIFLKGTLTQFTLLVYALLELEMLCGNDSLFATQLYSGFKPGMWKPKRKLEVVLFLWKRKREKSTASASTQEGRMEREKNWFCYSS